MRCLDYSMPSTLVRFAQAVDQLFIATRYLFSHFFFSEVFFFVFVIFKSIWEGVATERVEENYELLDWDRVPGITFVMVLATFVILIPACAFVHSLLYRCPDCSQFPASAISLVRYLCVTFDHYITQRSHD